MRRTRGIGLLAALCASAALADPPGFSFVEINVPIGDFRNVIQESGGRVFVIGNFTDLTASTVAPVGPPPSLHKPDFNPDAPFIFVEDGGVRMPDETVKSR